MDRLGQLVQWEEWEWERVVAAAPAPFPANVEHRAIHSDAETYIPHVPTLNLAPSVSPRGGGTSGAIP
eukprot:10613219-Lingulodinium_polyedra.AAC.1